MNPACENCGYESPAKRCPACGESAPLWAGFCPHCGAAMEKSKGAAEGPDPMAMENRRACFDGNCIGILGPDGRCVICGREA